MDSSKRKERGGNESLKGQGERRERSRKGGTWRSQAWRQKGRGHKRGAPGWGRGGGGGRERGRGPRLCAPGGPPLALSHSRPRVMLPRGCSPPVIRCSPNTSSGPIGCFLCSGPGLGPGPASGSDSDPDSDSACSSGLGSTFGPEAPGACSAPVPAPPPPFFTFMASRGRGSPAAAAAACAGWSREKGERPQPRPRPDRSPRYRPAPGVGPGLTPPTARPPGLRTRGREGARPGTSFIFPVGVFRVLATYSFLFAGFQPLRPSLCPSHMSSRLRAWDALPPEVASSRSSGLSSNVICSEALSDTPSLSDQPVFSNASSEIRFICSLTSPPTRPVR